MTLPVDPERRALYHQAFQAIVWGIPILNTLQLRSELKNHDAPEGALAIMGSARTGRIELLTLNNTTCYIFGNLSLKDGPLVLEVPAETGKAKLFGSLFNVWDTALEDFGPSGVDGGRGGKFAVLPPGFDDAEPTPLRYAPVPLPSGYSLISSSSFDIHFLLRSVPIGSATWQDTVDYAKTLRVYPLSEAGNPPATLWFDVTAIEDDVYFRGTPAADKQLFDLLDSYVQEEPAWTEDLVAHGMLKSLGIEKGKEFTPDDETTNLLAAAARDAFAYMGGYLEAGRAFARYWDDRSWGAIPLNKEIVASGATWNFEDFQDYHARALDLYYWGLGVPKVFDTEGGGTTFYLMVATDSKGGRLDGKSSYKLYVPADVPVKDFWSILLYSTTTRSYTDSSRFGLSSNDLIGKNLDDGPVDLYIGPTKPAASSSSNWLATDPKNGFFLCFRFYGPDGLSPHGPWKLDDVVKLPDDPA